MLSRSGTRGVCSGAISAVPRTRAPHGGRIYVCTRARVFACLPACLPACLRGVKAFMVCADPAEIYTKQLRGGSCCCFLDAAVAATPLNSPPSQFKDSMQVEVRVSLRNSKMDISEDTGIEFCKDSDKRRVFKKREKYLI